MLSIEVIGDFEKFCSLKEEWDLLLESSNSQSIFLTWEWLNPWWQHFGEGNSLLILLAKDNSGNLIGIAPLYIEKNGIRKIRFLGSRRVGSDFLGFISTKDKEQEFINSIFNYFADNRAIWDVIELNDLEDSAIGEVTSALKLYFFPSLVNKAEVCPYLKLGRDYEEIVQSLSQKMRSNLRWQTRQIENKHKMVFTSPQAVGEVKKDIDILFNLHDSRFKTKKEVSAFSNEKIKKFHYDVAEGFFLRGWLKMLFLKHDNKAVVCLHTFNYKGQLFYYQTGFDQSWGKRSLGTVLIGLAIKEAITAGLTMFHFLRGNEPYKRRWTQDTISTKTVLIANSTISGRLYIFVMKIKILIKRLINKLRGNNNE